MAAEPQRTYQPLVNGQNEEGSSKGNRDRDTVEGEKEAQEQQLLESSQDSRPRAPPAQLNWPRTQGGPRPYVGVAQQQQQAQQYQYQQVPQQPNNQHFFRGGSPQNFQNSIRRASPWSLLKAKIPGEQVQLERGPEHAIYRMQNAPDPGGMNGGGGPRPSSAGGMRMSQPGNLSRPPPQLSQEGGMPQMQQRPPYLQRTDSRSSMMGNPPSRPPSGMGMGGPPSMMRPIMRSSIEDDDDDVVISTGGAGSRPGSGMATRPPPGAPMQMRPNAPNRTPPQSPAPSQLPPPSRTPQPGRQPSLTSLTEHSETPVTPVSTAPLTMTTTTTTTTTNYVPPAPSTPVIAPSHKPNHTPSSRPELSVQSSHSTPTTTVISSHSQSSTKTNTITPSGSLATTVTTSIDTPTTLNTFTNSSPSPAPSNLATAPNTETSSVDVSSKSPCVAVGATPKLSKTMEERPPSVAVNYQVEEVTRPTDLGTAQKVTAGIPSHNDTSSQKDAIKDVESKKENIVNGSHASPKKSPTKAPVPNKLGKVHTPSKSPSKISPKTPETPGSTDKKKVPMNKIQVGAAPSPNLKSVKSKIGSLDNAKHKPGGGNIKIETRKIQINAAPRIEAKNEMYSPGGGEKKIQTVKLHWEAKPKVGSLENAAHRPGGGDKKIESVKLDFKDKAKPKVGSKDNLKHQPGGGSVKNAGESKEGSTIDIEDQKLEIKAESKVGSLENVKHKPGGGEVKIFDDKEYIRQMTGSNSDLHASSQGKRTRNSSTSRTRLSGSKSGTRENLSEDLMSPVKSNISAGGINKPPLPPTPTAALSASKPMDQNSNQLGTAVNSQPKMTVVNGSNQPPPADKEPPQTLTPSNS